MANAEVGDFFNQNFVCSYQKVGTFRIVNGNKQGGNVASYFCLPDGSVLHAIVGPIDAATLLKEARWVNETRKRGNLETRGEHVKMQMFMRQAHAERLLRESNAPLDVKKVPRTTTVDQFAVQYLNRPIFEAVADDPLHLRGHVLDNKGKVHAILAVYPLIKIEHVYKVVFEKILNEKVSTLPVDELDGAGGRKGGMKIR